MDTSTGAFQLAAEDLVFPTGLFGIAIRRAYRSDDERVGWFGRGWSTVYETAIVYTGDGVTIDAPAGLTPLWTPEAPAGWEVAGVPTLNPAGEGHTLSWPTGERWRFAGDGRLQSLTSPYGATVTLDRADGVVHLASSQGVTVDAHLTDGRIVSVESSDGRATSYEYAGDLLVGVHAPGVEQSYHYDGDRQLVESITPGGTTLVTYSGRTVSGHTTAAGEHFTFAYDGHTTTVTTAGTPAEFTHDEAGRLIRITVGGNDTLRQAFDEDGRLVERTEYAYPQGVIASSLERTYEGGRLASEVLDGVTADYAYDSRGRVTHVGGATPASFDYDDHSPLPTAVSTPATGRTRISYENGFAVSVTDATGTTTLTHRDPLGNPTATGTRDDGLWTSEFDAEGNVTARTSPSGRTWTYEWAPRGVLRLERDPLGRTVSYTYDAAGRLTRQTRPDSAVTVRSYTPGGQLAEETEPDGATTRYEYDTRGRVHTIVAPGDRTWRTAYDDLPDGSKTVTTTAPDGSTTVNRLDSADREFARIVAEADGSVVETTTNTYEFGRLVESVVRRRGSELTTTTAHDDAGRVVRITATLDGRTIRDDSYEYREGRIVEATTTDQTAAYDYDAAGRLLQVASGSDMWAVTYRDGDVATTRHNDRVTEIERDVDGRPVRFVDERGVTTTWGYDAVDRPRSRTVADATAHFEWDDGDRLLAYHAPTGASWTWTYDSAGRLLSAHEPNEVTTTYEYELGSVSTVHTEGPGPKRDEKYTYDSLGRLREARTSDGRFRYTSDASGRVVAVDDLDGNDDEAWSLDAAGQIVSVVSGGRTYALSYTPAGQLERIDGPDGDHLRARWEGNRLTEVDVDRNDPMTVATDLSGRLTALQWDSRTAVDVVWHDAESFTLQQRGSENAVEYTVNGGLLAGFHNQKLTYQANGRNDGFIESLAISGDKVAGTVSFDGAGRPATFVARDRTSTITYDGDGRVSSVLSSTPGRQPDQVTVPYGDDGVAKIDGERTLIEALFDRFGTLRQSPPEHPSQSLGGGWSTSFAPTSPGDRGDR